MRFCFRNREFPMFKSGKQFGTTAEYRKCKCNGEILLDGSQTINFYWSNNLNKMVRNLNPLSLIQKLFYSRHKFKHKMWTRFAFQWFPEIHTAAKILPAVSTLCLVNISMILFAKKLSIHNNISFLFHSQRFLIIGNLGLDYI